MSYLNKVGLESKEIWMRQSKGLRSAFPIDQPVWPRSPTVAVHEEGEVRVVKEELAIESFNGDRHVVLSSNEVKGGVCVVK